MKCERLLLVVRMAFTTAILDSSSDRSICVTSHTAETKVAVGGESPTEKSHCGSPLQMYLPISFRGCSIYVHLELLQKFHSQLCPPLSY